MTRLQHRQGGISFVGLVFVLILAAFAGLVALKLFPFYVTSFKIDATLKAVVEDPSMRNQTVNAIANSIIKRLDIDSVTLITKRNFSEYVTVTNKGGQITIDLFYDDEAHLFGNLYLRAEFDKHFEN